MFEISVQLKTRFKQIVLVHKTVTNELCAPKEAQTLQQENHINPFFALDIFICSFSKCIQHTMRGQSNFPLSKL